MAQIFRGKQMGEQGEEYSVNRRIRGGSFASRLNPKIVDRRLNAALAPNNWPSPLVRETSRNNPVMTGEGSDRLQRVEILAGRFKK
jgi:hypothetical protein